MIFRNLLVVGLVLLAAPDVLAQVAGSHGSIYSRFALGDRVDYHSSQAAMMGGAGVALPASASVSLANPALLADLDLVHLSVGAAVQGLRAVDAAGESSTLGAGHLSALQISLPLYQERLGVSLSLRPYTRVNYFVLDEGSIIEPQLPQDTLNYRVNLQGAGGLHEVQMGMGWRISSSLAIGFGGRAVFGLMENQQLTEYLLPLNIPETLVSQNTHMWGFGATLGTTFRTSGLLRSADRLMLGASLTLPTTLQTRRMSTTGFSLDQDTIRTETRGTTRLPLNLSAGLSYAPDAHWLFAADARYEPWSGFESDFAFSGYSPTGQNVLSDRIRVGGGLQFIPRPGAREEGLLARSAYRFGGYYDGGYVSPRNQTVSTIALTGGLSLPALRQGTRFDIGFEIGTRGTTQGELVRDLYLRGTATINFGERWFVRRQFG